MAGWTHWDELPYLESLSTKAQTFEEAFQEQNRLHDRLRGRHFDTIVVDDLVTTADELDRVRRNEWYRQQTSLGDSALKHLEAAMAEATKQQKGKLFEYAILRHPENQPSDLFAGPSTIVATSEENAKFKIIQQLTKTDTGIDLADVESGVLEFLIRPFKP